MLSSDPSSNRDVAAGSSCSSIAARQHVPPHCKPHCRPNRGLDAVPVANSLRLGRARIHFGAPAVVPPTEWFTTSRYLESACPETHCFPRFLSARACRTIPPRTLLTMTAISSSIASDRGSRNCVCCTVVAPRPDSDPLWCPRLGAPHRIGSQSRGVLHQHAPRVIAYCGSSINGSSVP